ncbi:hypothetical protein ACFRJ9_07025 [Paenarthrobacter sp. NPDC056912]|uniref:hypothetical protein n=1 Tax=Paenarthrobacter sp. NPDC056912 TaxID=3345965 RepID=UPI00366D0504
MGHLNKPVFVALVAAVATLIVASASWLTLLVMRGEAPNPLVVGALSLVGPLVGVFAGSKFWDDRETMRQRIAQNGKNIQVNSVD